MRRSTLAVCCLAALLAAVHRAPRPGDMERWRGDPVERVAAARAESMTLAGRQVKVWFPSGIAAAPLIVFSHGYLGCPSQSTFLTAALADAGYLVVAPRHQDASCGLAIPPFPQAPFWEPAAWSDQTYRDRRDDIVAVLDALHRDPTFAGRIDWSKIGLLGHSLGGYSVLGVAGAWPSWRISGVKAVVALSPFCAPFFNDEHGLADVSAPVQYQGGVLDIGITPVVGQPGGCYDQTPHPAEFINYKDAGHLAFTDFNATDHDSMIFYARAFFDVWLRGVAADVLRTKRPGVAELREK
jgi:predicted dienelactone hydrolase